MGHAAVTELISAPAKGRRLQCRAKLVTQYLTPARTNWT